MKSHNMHERNIRHDIMGARRNFCKSGKAQKKGLHKENYFFPGGGGEPLYSYTLAPPPPRAPMHDIVIVQINC